MNRLGTRHASLIKIRFMTQYMSLADLIGCDFWTADKAFYDSVKSHLQNPASSTLPRSVRKDLLNHDSAAELDDSEEQKEQRCCHQREFNRGGAGTLLQAGAWPFPYSPASN